MAKLNIGNMNTLFKKGYLLAGVMMAANMFVVNEVKASEDGQIDQKKEETKEGEIETKLEIKDFTKQENNEEGEANKKQSPLDKFLSCENYFNLFGTLALSCANNYFKLWDYNAGGYLNLRIGCLGWRTKKFFDIVQLDFNLNLGRGAFWAIPHIIKFRRSLTKAEIKDTTENKPNEEEVKKDEENKIKSVSNVSPWVSFLFKDILRGFVSAPLTFHISNFSIAISLDSILWAVIGKFLDLGKNNKINEYENFDEAQLNLKESSNNGDI